MWVKTKLKQNMYKEPVFQTIGLTTIMPLTSLLSKDDLEIALQKSYSVECWLEDQISTKQFINIFKNYDLIIIYWSKFAKKLSKAKEYVI